MTPEQTAQLEKKHAAAVQRVAQLEADAKRVAAKLEATKALIAGLETQLAAPAEAEAPAAK